MRRAARTDATQEPIVAALRKIGARAIYIKEPVDLLVGYRNATVLLELKDGEKFSSERRLTKQQEEFIATWPGGPVYVVSSVDEALRVVIEAARQGIPERESSCKG